MRTPHAAAHDDPEAPSREVARAHGGGPAKRKYAESEIMPSRRAASRKQAAAPQSAVGASWIVRQEARGMMNTPAELAGYDSSRRSPCSWAISRARTTLRRKVTPPYAPVSLEGGKGTRATGGHGDGRSCKACASPRRGRARAAVAARHAAPTDEETINEPILRFSSTRAALPQRARRDGAKPGRRTDRPPDWSRTSSAGMSSMTISPPPSCRTRQRRQSGR